ncbi:hypothetical protein WOLCODRAFT_93180 [Wolfiporia cocos MD-104 SS10]|uniref:Uncharacterized protein n=1 Tax=Wolfiporia cocos (strain MD-104) TaxID=742152 RepID=A0A2H3J6G5_WOLCO|nr:hypothetical protein WOLCODRAFT_93180 [Wolfiporia cocos MD-104 SS10]
MSMLRTAFASTAPAVRGSTRAFHGTPAAAKSATETVKEVADKVNKSVGRGLASAIEKGEEATEASKETLRRWSRARYMRTIEVTSHASQKANRTSAGVREGTQDFKHDVQKEARK